MIGKRWNRQKTEAAGRLCFGRLLADALKGRRMKQEDLARSLGTTQSSVSGWINGKYEPAAATVFTIEHALGLDLARSPARSGTCRWSRRRSRSASKRRSPRADLDDEAKAALASIYRALVTHSARAPRPRRPAISRPARRVTGSCARRPPDNERHPSQAGTNADCPRRRVLSASVAYQSLYRRYRSQRWSELKGQDHVSQTLRNAVREGRVSHAYLFSGPRGTGKTSSARILAKALNCPNPADGEPCGVVRLLRRDHRGPVARRGRARRRLQPGRRRHAGAGRRGPPWARPGAGRSTSSTRSTC